MLTLRYNPASKRFDCYCKGEFIQTLTCGIKFNPYCDKEGLVVAGKN